VSDEMNRSGRMLPSIGSNPVGELPGHPPVVGLGGLVEQRPERGRPVVQFHGGARRLLGQDPTQAQAVERHAVDARQDDHQPAVGVA
jgi:hypothetical protein